MLIRVEEQYRLLFFHALTKQKNLSKKCTRTIVTNFEYFDRNLIPITEESFIGACVLLLPDVVVLAA